ncbi:MAG: HAD hydrolase-like protein [Lachnospiraceae bacterium]|nr:HAD hydrolase-like protein [Lachnospiraceae bacterium]
MCFHGCGQLYQATADYNICLGDSWMIGDSWRDVEAGHSAGCKTALLVGEGTEGAGMDPGDAIRGNDTGCNPDMVESNLLKVVRKILL